MSSSNQVVKNSTGKGLKKLTALAKDNRPK
jgi:hypothetical protein